MKLHGIWLIRCGLFMLHYLLVQTNKDFGMCMCVCVYVCVCVVVNTTMSCVINL